MAKHGRRKPLFVPRIAATTVLSTLAANDMISTAFATLLDQEVYAISMDVTASLHGLTSGEGPIICGVAHSDYTAAEIEEWFEASGSWSKTDKIEQEHARRKCREIGIFDGNSPESTINDGRKLRVKLGFPIEDGAGLQLWVFNEGAAALTTGAVVDLKGKAFLRTQ